MSILIKNMEMPKSCNACMFDVYGLCLINKHIEVKDELTHSWPLVPVPPHGRLIDADALPTNDKPIGKLMMFGGEYVYTQTAINNAPTVIPADGKDIKVPTREEEI